jgi:hypothetical protein
MKETLNFLGQRVIILHRPGDATDRLIRQCDLLGLRAEARWRPLHSGEEVDIVLVDADEGSDGLLPWTPTERPAPLVALLASEAPAASLGRSIRAVMRSSPNLSCFSGLSRVGDGDTPACGGPVA